MAGLGGTLLTGAYSGRLYRLAFSAEPRGVNPLPQHEPPYLLISLLVLLGALSTSSGWLIFELSGAFPSLPEANHFLNAEQGASVASSTVPVACVFGGLLLGFQATPSWLTTPLQNPAFNQAA